MTPNSSILLNTQVSAWCQSKVLSTYILGNGRAYVYALVGGAFMCDKKGAVVTGSEVMQRRLVHLYV